MSSVVLIIVNDPEFFLSHRLAVALAAQDAGHRVCVATMPGRSVKRIKELGLEHYILPMTRSGSNLITEVRAFSAILRLLKRLRPNILHLVTIKPVLYGGVAARLLGIEGVVAAVSGLGFVFIARGVKAAVVRSIVKRLYRVALRGDNVKVIFQNPDDRDSLLSMKAVKPLQVEMIRGSGVDLAHFTAVPEAEGIPVVCMAARLLVDKGVREFVQAAKLIKARGIVAHFILVGAIDPGNPASITEEEVKDWSSAGDVELLGHREHMPDLLRSVHIVILPSYREGLPKVLIEAAACGRAVITTNVPGCRDAITPEITGLTVPVKDPVALAEAIQLLIENPALRQKMGRDGRKLAEEAFAIEKIVDQHMAIYRDLLANR